MLSRRARGFTLIEMVIAIVVIGVGIAGVMLAFGVSTRGSANPLVQRQLLAVAEGLLEEVLSKPYEPVAGGGGGGCSREAFNDVDDYNGYAQALCEIDGGAMPASLADYSVRISVQATLLGGVAAKQVSVTAIRGGDSLLLQGWRVGLTP
jgi:MSHA pilin protein MshD